MSTKRGAFKRHSRHFAILSVVAGLFFAASSFSCTPSHRGSIAPLLEHVDFQPDPDSLVAGFAPIFHMQPQDPFPIVAIIPVHHPELPIIAYHVFFQDDAFLAGRGKTSDHEILWIEYDRITCKLVDIATLWHRTVLRTESSVMEARKSAQRPEADIQWGQHGILPLGWRDLKTARPRAELWAHYQLMHHASRVPGLSVRKRAVSFDGTYEQYLCFSDIVDSRDFLRGTKTIISVDPMEDLRTRMGQTIPVKKAWPSW